MKKNKFFALGLMTILISKPMTSFAYDILLMGGGGEPQCMPGGTGKNARPECEQTIFDNGLNAFATSKRNLDVNLKVSFNGGHDQTEAIIKEKITGGAAEVPSFTLENYQAMIKEAIRKIKSGETKEGENLLVIVDTHGGENDSPLPRNTKKDKIEKGKYITHTISLARGPEAENKNLISGTSMDLLIELADLAEEKNINLGIVDMSCHSGLSLPIANKNTCVVSSTGTNHYGYGTFAVAFYEEMKAGKTMEEVYLSARSKSMDFGFPMISTNTAQDLNNTIYKLFTPYLFMRHDSNADKITSYLARVSKSNDLLCERENNFAKLISDIDDFEKIAGAAVSKYSQYGKLKDKVIEYKKMQDDLIRELKNSDLMIMDKTETIPYTVEDPKTKKPIQAKTESLSYEAILNFPAGNLDYFKEQLPKKKKGSSEYKETMITIAKITAILKRQEELKKESSEMAKASAVYAKIDEMKQKIIDTAMPISELSRRVYDQRYKAQAKNDQTPNACKNFKF